jgi:hypothetical protein
MKKHILLTLGIALLCAASSRSMDSHPRNRSLPKKQKDVEAKVLKILTNKKLVEHCWWEDTDAEVKHLEDIGRDALPVILRALPNLSAPAVYIAARVFQDSNYREAAPALAAILPALHPCNDSGWARNNAVIAVLQSLAEIGDDSQISSVSTIMLNDAQNMEERREAFAALASIGGPEVTGLLDSTIDSLTPKPHSWWVPPDPGKYIDRFGTPVTRREILNVDRHDIEKWWWLIRAQGSTRLRYESHDLYLFPYEGFGGEADLWLIEHGSNGKRGQAKFLGISPHGNKIVHDSVRYQAKIEGNALMITSPVGVKKTIDLHSIEIDSDEDGLPDLVEQRIHSDPHKRDSDSDGESDAIDLSPNSHGQPADEKQEITAAIFQQFFAFTSHRDHNVKLTVMVSDFQLDWKGIEGPVITLSPSEDEAFLREAGYNGAAHVTIRPAKASPGDDWPRPGPDERLYDLTIYRGGLDASGYSIVVRKITDQWYIRRIELSWLS